MKKLVVILGATGKQGGSVVDAFLHDGRYTIRGVTRNPESKGGDALRRKGVEVVRADLGDARSLEEGFEGANIIYAMTADVGVNSSIIKDPPPGKRVVDVAYDIEVEQGRSIIEAASKTSTLEIFILSSLSAAKRISKGKYSQIFHFDAKAAAVDFLQEKHPDLAKKTAILQLGLFATNWTRPDAFTKQPDGRWRILLPTPADALHPFVDPEADPAIFVKALAELPPAHELRTYAGFGEMMSVPQWAELLSRHLRIECYFQETTVEEWAKTLTFLPGIGQELGEMWAYSAEFGYFGPWKDVIPVTTLDLERAPTSMKEYVKREDWTKTIG